VTGFSSKGVKGGLDRVKLVFRARKRGGKG